MPATRAIHPTTFGQEDEKWLIRSIDKSERSGYYRAFHAIYRVNFHLYDHRLAALPRGGWRCWTGRRAANAQTGGGAQVSHEWWYTVTVGLDGILIAAGALNVGVVRRLLIRRVSVDLIVASFGLIVLSTAHLSETLLGVFFGFIGEGPPELVHRMLVLAAFLCLVYGLGRTGRDLWRERGLVLQANEELRVAQEELRLSNEELRECNRQLVESYVRETAAMRREPIRIVVADPDPDVRRVLTLVFAAENDMPV